MHRYLMFVDTDCLTTLLYFTRASVTVSLNEGVATNFLYLTHWDEVMPGQYKRNVGQRGSGGDLRTVNEQLLAVLRDGALPSLALVRQH